MILHLLNGDNDVELMRKFDIYGIVTSLKSESLGKLMNSIQVLCLLRSSLPSKALRMLIELQGSAEAFGFKKVC